VDRPVLSSVPDVTFVEIDTTLNYALVVASDGFWDSLYKHSPNEQVELILKYIWELFYKVPAGVASALSQRKADYFVQDQGRCDDCSVGIMFFQGTARLGGSESDGEEEEEEEVDVGETPLQEVLSAGNRQENGKEIPKSRASSDSPFSPLPKTAPVSVPPPILPHTSPTSLGNRPMRSTQVVRTLSKPDEEDRREKERPVQPKGKAKDNEKDLDAAPAKKARPTPVSEDTLPTRDVSSRRISGAGDQKERTILPVTVDMKMKRHVSRRQSSDAREVMNDRPASDLEEQKTIASAPSRSHSRPASRRHSSTETTPQPSPGRRQSVARLKVEPEEGQGSLPVTEVPLRAERLRRASSLGGGLPLGSSSAAEESPNMSAAASPTKQSLPSSLSASPVPGVPAGAGVPSRRPKRTHKPTFDDDNFVKSITERLMTPVPVSTSPKPPRFPLHAISLAPMTEPPHAPFPLAVKEEAPKRKKSEKNQPLLSKVPAPVTPAAPPGAFRMEVPSPTTGILIPSWLHQQPAARPSYPINGDRGLNAPRPMAPQPQSRPPPSHQLPSLSSTLPPFQPQFYNQGLQFQQSRSPPASPMQRRLSRGDLSRMQQQQQQQQQQNPFPLPGVPSPTLRPTTRSNSQVMDDAAAGELLLALTGGRR